MLLFVLLLLPLLVDCSYRCRHLESHAAAAISRSDAGTICLLLLLPPAVDGAAAPAAAWPAAVAGAAFCVIYMHACSDRLVLQQLAMRRLATADVITLCTSTTSSRSICSMRWRPGAWLPGTAAGLLQRRRCIRLCGLQQLLGSSSSSTARP